MPVVERQVITRGGQPGRPAGLLQQTCAALPVHALDADPQRLGLTGLRGEDQLDVPVTAQSHAGLQDAGIGQHQRVFVRHEP